MTEAVRTLINTIKTNSDSENSVTKEATLRGFFEELRDHVYFKNSQITSYTYDPLIGITSVTDPRGYTMYYGYDAFNRLKTVKDADGNMVSENKYHYKNQQ